jgi:hypothetical protein
MAGHHHVYSRSKKALHKPGIRTRGQGPLVVEISFWQCGEAKPLSLKMYLYGKRFIDP